MRDFNVGAVKTGMLASADVIRLVAKKVKEYDISNLVVDPVMVATSGDRLLDESALKEMRKLVSAAKISTPNINEAEILSGLKINSIHDMHKAADKIGDCVVKGGHLNGVDVLSYGGQIIQYRSRIGRKKIMLHGAGCAFSAAIAASFTRGYDVIEAVAAAKEHVDASIERFYRAGEGAYLLDTGNIKLSVSVQDNKEKQVLGNVEQAVYRFINHRLTYKLVPEVGSNIALALPDAQTIMDVAGLSGRMVRAADDIACAGVIRFGGSSHMARVVLAAMKHDKRMRAALNLRYSKEILDVGGDLGYVVSCFDRQMEPTGTDTMDWGINKALMDSKLFPDLIFDEGAPGKEPMIRVLGSSASGVVDKSLKLAETLN